MVIADKDEKKLSIEEALEQLDTLLARLENKECPLEESFHLYKADMSHLLHRQKFCRVQEPSFRPPA